MRDTQNRGITGATGAAPIWADFMTRATDGEPSREFLIPADIRLEKVNPVSGVVAAAGTEQPMQVALRVGQDTVQATDDATATPESATKTRQRSTIVEEDLLPER